MVLHRRSIENWRQKKWAIQDIICRFSNVTYILRSGPYPYHPKRVRLLHMSLWLLMEFLRPQSYSHIKVPTWNSKHFLCGSKLAPQVLSPHLHKLTNKAAAIATASFYINAYSTATRITLLLINGNIGHLSFSKHNLTFLTYHH